MRIYWIIFEIIVILLDLLENISKIITIMRTLSNIVQTNADIVEIIKHMALLIIEVGSLRADYCVMLAR